MDKERYYRPEEEMADLEDYKTKFETERRKAKTPFYFDPREYITQDQFDEKVQLLFSQVADLVRIEFDRREEFLLESIKKSINEETQKLVLGKNLEQEINIRHIFTELNENISKDKFPNPNIYLKKIDSQKIIYVVIDDSENYLDYLFEFSNIINNIYRKYDLDLEILLFERGEIINPLEEQGFEELQ